MNVQFIEEYLKALADVAIRKQPKNMSKLWIIVFFSCRFHWLKQ